MMFGFSNVIEVVNSPPSDVVACFARREDYCCAFARRVFSATASSPDLCAGCVILDRLCVDWKSGRDRFAGIDVFTSHTGSRLPELETCPSADVYRFPCWPSRRSLRLVRRNGRERLARAAAVRASTGSFDCARRLAGLADMLCSG